MLYDLQPIAYGRAMIETRKFLEEQIASCEAQAGSADLAQVKARLLGSAQAWRDQLVRLESVERGRDRRNSVEA